MKEKKFKIIFLLVTLAIIFAGCKKDGGEEQISPFVGNYVISSAVITEAFTINIIVEGIELPFSVPAGTPITGGIRTALLGQVDCSSADKTWVELHKDYKIVLSCEGTNPLDAGTWEEVSPTELKLNMNSAAIPSSPGGFLLTVSDISIAGTTMTGNTGVPLPVDMIGAILSDLGMDIGENNPSVIPVKFAVVFNKKQ